MVADICARPARLFLQFKGFALSLAAILATASAAVGTPFFSSIENASLENSTRSEVLGISPNGEWIVGESTSGAFRWSESTGAQLLRNLNDDGTQFNSARDVDNSGNVIIGTNSGSAAVRWRIDNGGQTLWSGTAVSMSADGSVLAGQESNRTVIAEYDTATNQLSSGPTTLGLGAGLGVSADGERIVGTINNNQPFRFDRLTQTLQVLRASDGLTRSGRAEAISADKSRIVGISDGGAAFWNGDALAAVDIGGGRAFDVLGDGRTIAGADGGAGFVWTDTPGGSPTRVDAETFFQSKGLDLSGINRITSVRNVSDDGFTFSGNAINSNNQLEGWVASIPALVSKDLSAAGDGLITRDVKTGLEWLDLTTSVNRSFNDVSSQFALDGDFEGFRYATFNEVTTLFENAGIPDVGVNQASETSANFLPVQAAQDLFGRTLDLPNAVRSQGLFDDGASSPNPALVGQALLSRTPGQTVANVEVFTDTPGKDLTHPALGSWLVRDLEQPTLPNPVGVVSGNLEIVSGFVNDPDAPTVIFTHGYVPNGNDASYGLSMANSIADRLIDEGIVANVGFYNWEEYATGSAGTGTDFYVATLLFEILYKSSLTFNHGSILAEEIKDFELNNIYFIGHSLGTHVVSNAAKKLERAGIDVEQVTVLDRPFGNIGNVITTPFPINLFREHLSILEDIKFSGELGGIEMVDNYFGSDKESGIDANNFSAVGVSLNVARAFNNPEILGANHLEFLSSFYCGTVPVQGGFCNIGPIFGGFNFSTSLGKLPSTTANEQENTGARLKTLNSINLEEFSSINSVVFDNAVEAVLTEGSPAFLWGDIAIPNDALSLSFEFLWDSLGDGDFLNVYFGNTLLFSFLGETFSGSEFIETGPIFISNLAGKNGQLLFSLNSVGNANSQFHMRNVSE